MSITRAFNIYQTFTEKQSSDGAGNGRLLIQSAWLDASTERKDAQIAWRASSGKFGE
jgi:hypothetical protein